MVESVLIITTSGGRGLLQAAFIKEEQILLKDPQAVIVKRNILSDWFGKRFGRFAEWAWNTSQKKGKVSIQKFFLNGKIILDIFFWPKVFLCSFQVINREQIDRVIDTQNFSTSAIVKSIRLYNWLKGKTVTYEKFMIDLPTKKNKHFFSPIKRCSRADRSHIKLVTIEPLLEKNQTEGEFWKKHCGLPLKNIVYDSFMVRQSFLSFENKPPCVEDIDLTIGFSSNEEKQMMKRVFSKGKVQSLEKDHSFIFHITPSERVATALLGSFPSEKGILDYVKQMISFAKTQSQNIVFFVYCANFDRSINPLFQNLCDSVCELTSFPENLSIIPFSYQTQANVAPLFYRSDITITRTGGGTAMELMSVAKGDILIHSETMSQKATREQLLKGIPGHESGAAEYLEEKVGAKIVNPQLFLSYLNQRSEKVTSS